MRTLLVGAVGQLATDLARVLGDDVVPLAHAALDIGDAEGVARALDAAGAERVVNAAAWNLVDRAEDEPAKAFTVNAFGPRNLARWCATRDAILVHFSTDYVFGLDEARRRPYAETDPPAPLSVYAASKLAGEQFVQAICPRHFVIRTCGLYGVSPTRTKGNFVETMLRLGRERTEVRVVDDQRCTPTFTFDLAAAVARLLETDAYGLYHATNAGDMTWCEFAREIFRQSGLSTNVVPITTAAFGAQARRPAYSVLNGARLADATGQNLPAWQDALARYLQLRTVSAEKTGE